MAGFILIFLGVIIFGYIFLELSPKSNIELQDVEASNFLMRNKLMNFLDYDTADEIIIGVRDGKLDGVEEKAKKLIHCDNIYWKYAVSYCGLVIYKDGEVFREIDIFGSKGKGEDYSYSVFLGEDVAVELNSQMIFRMGMI